MKSIDTDQLLGCTNSRQTKEQLHRIFAWRKQVLAKNEFIKDESPFLLELRGLSFNFKVSSSFSAIETFHEIFVQNGHCKIPQFLPQEAETVLDIGANQGFYAIKMAVGNPGCCIYCFEPNPIEFEVLQQNLSSNALENRVKAEELAVSGSRGEIEMEIIPEIGPIGGQSIRTPFRKWLKDEFIKNIRVQSICLEDVLTRNNLAHVDILKLDVEGFELDVLRNFQSFDVIDKLVVEYHSDSGREELLELMKANGFELACIDAEPGDYYGDLYFIRK